LNVTSGLHGERLSPSYHFTALITLWLILYYKHGRK
jgi:hypothetical protein